MKNFKLLTVILLSFIFCCSLFSQETTTIVFKPSSAEGKDALIWNLHNDCILNGQSQTPANLNYGHLPELTSMSWTWGAKGCKRGDIRFLIHFTELNNIPTNAEIVSAELKLFGSESAYIADKGNHGENHCWVEKITSPWHENSVTWNRQPSTTSSNRFKIGPSNTTWNWHCTNNSQNLVSIVQDMVYNPDSNHGFMIKLQIEETYRTLTFASSEHNDRALHPELVVKYIEPCNADANFEISSHSNNGSFRFTAHTNGTSQWKVDGGEWQASIPNTQQFQYFPNCYGCTYNISHMITTPNNNRCIETINICTPTLFYSEKVPILSSTHSNTIVTKTFLISEDTLNLDNRTSKDDINVERGIAIPADIIVPEISISQNPTETNWNIRIDATIDEKIEINLLDNMGNSVYRDTKNIFIGTNPIIIGNQNIDKGIYILKIDGEISSFTERLQKQ